MRRGCEGVTKGVRIGRVPLSVPSKVPGGNGVRSRCEGEAKVVRRGFKGRCKGGAKEVAYL